MLAQAAGLALLSALSPTVLTGVLVAAGGIMVSDGIYGLITRSG